MKKNCLKTLLAALFTTIALTLSAEPALLGNKVLNGQALDGESVKAVLMGKKVALGDARVVLVIAKSGDAQNAFLQAHVGMTTIQFQNYWRRLFMTGGGSAPKIVETEAEACKIVAETSGAVTVADSAVANGLVVLSK